MNTAVVITMIICAVVVFGGLALLSRFLIRRRSAPSTDFTGCPIASATIVDRRSTHRAINKAYLWVLTLDVQPPDGQRFPATSEVRIVSTAQGSTLLPGTVVPVRYRPGVPGVVEVAFDQIPGGHGPLQVAWSASRSWPNRR